MGLTYILENPPSESEGPQIKFSEAVLKDPSSGWFYEPQVEGIPETEAATNIARVDANFSYFLQIKIGRCCVIRDVRVRLLWLSRVLCSDEIELWLRWRDVWGRMLRYEALMSLASYDIEGEHRLCEDSRVFSDWSVGRCFDKPDTEDVNIYSKILKSFCKMLLFSSTMCVRLWKWWWQRCHWRAGFVAWHSLVNITGSVWDNKPYEGYEHVTIHIKYLQVQAWSWSVFLAVLGYQ